MHTLAALGYLPKLRRVMGLVVSADFLHTVFYKNVSYQYQMAKFYYLGCVALTVNVLQIESECSRLKLHWAFTSYLAASQRILRHYQKDSLTTLMLITALSTILTQMSPGDL